MGIRGFRVEKSQKVSKGPDFSLTLEKKDGDLTAAMLTDGSWKTRKVCDFCMRDEKQFITLCLVLLRARCLVLCIEPFFPPRVVSSRS